MIYINTLSCFLPGSPVYMYIKLATMIEVIFGLKLTNPIQVFAELSMD